jgi:N6-adenosine-specific RNA methylase IME4
MEKYNTIYIDPPWHLEEFKVKMLTRVPVEALSMDNAMLMLWCSQEGLPECLAQMEAWDFDYVQLWTWLRKDEKEDFWFQFHGESLLIGVKGLVRIDYLLRHNVFEYSGNEARYHPQEFKDLASEAAIRAFSPPIMLDVFGAYWHRHDPEYWRDDWHWWEGGMMVLD